MARAMRAALLVLALLLTLAGALAAHPLDAQAMNGDPCGPFGPFESIGTEIKGGIKYEIFRKKRTCTHTEFPPGTRNPRYASTYTYTEFGEEKLVPIPSVKSPRRASVDGRGRARVRVTCRATGATCRGTISLRVSLASRRAIRRSGRFTIASGRSRTVVLGRNARLARALRSHRIRRARIIVTLAGQRPRVARVTLVKRR